MKTRHFLNIIIALLAVLGLNCSDDNGVIYSNHHDPLSNVYVPSAPDSLKATIESSSLIRLVWMRTSYREQGFRIYRKIGRYSLFKKIAEVPARASDYKDSLSLRPGETYYYQVETVGKLLYWGEYSPETSVTFNLPSPSLRLKSAGSNSAGLEWDKSGTWATGYILERATGNGPFTVLARLQADALSYVDSYLDTRNTYSYRIKASSGNAESGYSPSVNIIYSLTDLQKVRTVELGNNVQSIAISPDGTKLAAAGASSALRVWNLSDGRLLQDLSYKGSNGSSSASVFHVAFSHDGKLLTATRDRYADPNSSTGDILAVWRISDGMVLRSVQGATGLDEPSAICFSRDDSKILEGNSEGRIRAWNISDGKLVREVNAAQSSGFVTRLYASKDGTKIYAGTDGGIMEVLNSASWAPVASFTGTSYGSYGISNDEKYYAYYGIVTSLTTGEVVVRLKGYSFAEVCFNSDGGILLGRLYPGGVVATLISDPNISVSKALPLSSGLQAIAASPNSDYFALTGETYGTVEVWEIVKGWRVY